MKSRTTLFLVTYESLYTYELKSKAYLEKEVKQKKELLLKK
jgi:hypothetical protein